MVSQSMSSHLALKINFVIPALKSITEADHQDQQLIIVILTYL